MNMKWLKTIFLAITLLIPALVQAQTSEAEKTTFPIVTWISKSSTDPVTIQNGAGTPIIIMINVFGGGSNAPGVNVSNCGTTTTIKAGSSTVCETNDSANPVTLSSDSSVSPAKGTYQIKQK